MTVLPPSDLRASLQSRVRWGCSLLAGLSLWGCAEFAPPAMPSDARVWTDTATMGLNSSGSQAAIDAQWWKAYGSAPLNALMEQAVALNPTLQMAQARWRRASASIAMAEALNRPQTNATWDATHQRFTANGLVSPPMAGSIQDTATVQAAVSWEFDFFGKNQAALDAALGQARAAQADTAAARVFLHTQVARIYLRLMGLHSLQQIAQRTLQQREDWLSLVRQRVRAGLDSNLELQQAEGAVPEARAQIDSLREQIELTHTALMALVAAPGSRPALEPISLHELKAPALPAAVPADLLGRRPDVLAARWRVEAAVGEQRQAQAQFYPNINLVAFVGLSSIGLDRLLQSGSQQWGLGPAVRLPLFDSGRLRANLQGKTAEWEMAVHSYNATVLEAVKDVVDPLTSLSSLAQLQAQQSQTLATAEKTYALVRQRRDAGLANTLQVLQAETALLQQQRLGIELHARMLDTQVALIRALGGGFGAEPATASAQAPAPLRSRDKE